MKKELFSSYSLNEKEKNQLIDIGLNEYIKLYNSFYSKNTKENQKTIIVLENKCVFCGKVFINQNELKLHLKGCDFSPDDQRDLESIKK